MGDANYSRNPVFHHHYRYIAFGMTLVAVGKPEWWGYKPSKNILVWLSGKIFTAIGPVVSFLEILYGYSHFEILKKTHLVLSYFISVTLYGIATIKLLTAQTSVYKLCMTSFIKEFHLNHFQDKNDYNKKKAETVERISLYIRYFFIVSIFVDECMWVIIPLKTNLMYLEKINNRTMILQGGTYIWTPFDSMFNFRNWLLLEIFFMLYLQFGIGFVLFCVDTMVFNFMLHVIGHLYILKNDIVTQNWALSDSDVRQKLIDIHSQYIFIKRYFKIFEAAYGLNIGAIFLFNLISDSLLMYLLMFNEKENQVLYLLIGLYFLTSLIALSYAAEKIRTLSEDIFTAIYSCPWESMSLSNQKVLLLMLVQSQELMDFKACGFSIGYQPMISIIKTTLSYYVMLKETNK